MENIENENIENENIENEEDEYKGGVHCYGCYEMYKDLNKTQHHVYSENYVFCVNCIEHCIEFSITRAF